MTDLTTGGREADDLAARLEGLAAGVSEPAAKAPAMAPAPVPASAPQKRRARPDAVLLPAGFLVACAGIAFAIGRVTAPAAGYEAAAVVTDAGSDGSGAAAMQGGMTPPGMDASAGTMPAGGPPGAMGGSPSIDGTVTDVSADALTITLADGSTRTIATSADTGYHTESAATGGDVAVGMTVSVSLDVSDAAASDPSAAAASDVTILDE